jgi:hypothetical protein
MSTFAPENLISKMCNSGICTAPKNGKKILGHFGYPWYLSAVWSESDSGWVCADLQCGMYRGKDDPYFENERFNDKELKGWIEYPKIGELK